MRREYVKTPGVRLAAVLLLVAALLAACGEGEARGRMYVRDLRGYVAFRTAEGVTRTDLMPKDIESIVNREDMLGDLEDAFLAADAGELDAYVDPNFKRIEVTASPRFALSVRDDRSWTTFVTDNMLAAIRIYDRYRDSFVAYGYWAGSWSVSDIRMVLDVEDGGRYDMDGYVNGSVTVEIALGAGMTDDEDFTESLLGGGCATGATPWGMLLLVPLVVAGRCRR